ncbi:MAG: ATP synthase F1 subunit delta [Chitinophagaceae bacterium]|nr:ATP synthase F1 subunit delta [Chitinophagaceae bacterium]
MLNPRLAGRYAKSIIGLATEQNQLENVYQDMLLLQAVCKSNRDFVILLKSPVVTPDKKEAILQAATKGRITELTAAFNRLLIKKGRESVLPEIIDAFIEQYKHQKGIHTIRLTTAVPVSEELKQAIIDKIQTLTPMKTVEMETVVREDIIGGFLLEIGDTLVDASISYDLNKIRSQFLNNDFIYKIR